MADIRYAFRSLLQARWFTAGAIFTFALGIGVNVAVFSAVDRMLFRKLPYERPHELGVLGEYTGTMERPYGTLPAAYVVGARQLGSVIDASSAGWNSYGYFTTPEPGDEPAIRLTEASYNLLSVLGVRPFAGRDFTKEDAQAQRREILIGYEVWQSRFGGATDILGRQLWSDSKPAEVIGVLPKDFIHASYFLDPESQGLLLDFTTFDFATPRDRATPPTVRLKPGVSFEAAQAEIDAMVSRLRTEQPAPRPGAALSMVKLKPLEGMLFGGYRTYLLVVASAAALVLLVACANLASLMLVRARSREQQTAVCIALGASRARLIRGPLIESMMLAASGGFVAALVLIWIRTGLDHALPPVFSRYSADMSDLRVLAAFAGIAALSAAVTGVVPGWRASKVDVLPALQQAAGRGTSRRLGGRSLLIVEAALSVLLVAGAAATGRTLIGLLNRDIGVDPAGLYSVRIRLPSIPDAAARFEAFSRAFEALKTVPDVQSASEADYSPLSGALTEPIAPEYARSGQVYRVNDTFFATHRASFIAGRAFTADEVRSRASVGIMNARVLGLVWPGVPASQAVGRFLETSTRPPIQIVGIVGDMRGSYASSGFASLFLPLTSDGFRYMEFAVRTGSGRAPSLVEVRQRVKAAGVVPTSISIGDVAKGYRDSLLNDRFRAVLFGAFGVAALVLAAIGLYSVSSFEVALRRREIGVRLSMGASPQSVLKLVLTDAVRPVVIGVVLGLGLTYWAAQFLQSFLTMVDARDPATFGLVAVALLAASFAAAWLPARRAARTDPAIVLRTQ